MSISLRADRRLIRAEARGRRFIRIELAAPEAPPRKDRIPVNLAFVLDRSGSMAGDKIEKAREAAVQGIRSLWPEGPIGNSIRPIGNSIRGRHGRHVLPRHGTSQRERQRGRNAHGECEEARGVVSVCRQALRLRPPR